MAATASEPQEYVEVCTVAVTHMPPGRGSNEGEISDTVLNTFRRVGYQASEHAIMGFGSSATLAPEIPLGLVVKAVWKLKEVASNWIETRRQREIEAHWPFCVIQLIVTGHGEKRYGPPANLTAELLAVLPVVITDLKAANFCRKYQFMIYGTAPEYAQVTMNVYEEHVKLKHLVKLVRSCQIKPRADAPQVRTLNVSLSRRYWWAPMRARTVVHPSIPGLNVVDRERPPVTS